MYIMFVCHNIHVLSQIILVFFMFSKTEMGVVVVEGVMLTTGNFSDLHLK